MGRKMIDEAVIEAARERLARVGRVKAVRRVRQEEEDLFYAVSRYAVDALNSVEGANGEAQEAAYAAVWEAVLLALECYRMAHYRLWRGTVLGTLLAKLDPSLRRRSALPRDRDSSGGNGVAP